MINVLRLSIHTTDRRGIEEMGDTYIAIIVAGKSIYRSLTHLLCRWKDASQTLGTFLGHVYAMDLILN